MSLLKKIKYIPLFPVFVLVIISIFALIMLCSINSGDFFPWGAKQLGKMCVGFLFLVLGAILPIAIWKKHAYIFYIFGLMLLVGVEVAGRNIMGAQRWLNLYFFNLQPSEIMRLLLVVALSKYFSEIGLDKIKKTFYLILSSILIFIPLGLVSMQPDLGTAILLFLVGVSIFFICGVQIWKFLVAFLAVFSALPIAWNFLHEYQKKRIFMFLSPESDPSGAGYHIIQSKIALGSGGIFGNGLMNGTQCKLNFLPEKQTDFIFSALGCCFLILLYSVLMMYNSSVALKMKSRFKQIFIFGLNTMLFFYIVINISMVCGLLPVVGIPLPFFSYGGSALVVLLFAQGCIFSCDIEHKMKIGSKFSA